MPLLAYPIPPPNRGSLEASSAFRLNVVGRQKLVRCSFGPFFFCFYVQSFYPTRSASSLKLHSCTSCPCTYASAFDKPRYTLMLQKTQFILCCKLPCLVTAYLRVFWVLREHRTCYTSERYHRVIVRYVHKKSASYPICELKKKTRTAIF